MCNTRGGPLHETNLKFCRVVDFEWHLMTTELLTNGFNCKIYNFMHEIFFFWLCPRDARLFSLQGWLSLKIKPVLFCLLSLLQNQISWIRRRDWHILSSGSQLYTNDERFAILHTPGSNVWTLQIKFVQRRDSGMYECQVSTKGDTKTKSKKWAELIKLMEKEREKHYFAYFRFAILQPPVG